MKLLLLLLATAVPVLPASTSAETLVFDQPQLAGISGFRASWDTPIPLAGDGPVVTTEHNPGGAGLNAVWALEKRDGGAKPGAIVFDAVHRSALVRFPGCAQRIADELRKGFAIEKVELVLPHRATELWAEGYAEPPGGMAIEADGKVGMLRATVNPGARWLAVEHALRPGDSPAGMAETLRVNGLEGFVVEVNGQPATLSADRRVKLKR